jgi:glutathione S-transferase
MKLLYTPIKGYVHTVEAVIHYTGLKDAIEPIATKPFDVDTPLVATNPLGKVPTLVLDNGEYLAGGPVIYEYLDSLHRRRRLIPAKGDARWRVLRQAWMADGLFDTFVLLIIESWHEPATQRADYIQRCLRKIIAILDQMERDVASYERLDLAQIRGIGALQFLRLKLPTVARATIGLEAPFDPFDGRPRLESWYKSLYRKKMFREPLIRVD